VAKKLRGKQAVFRDEYLVDLNATAAAERAGYSDPNYGRQLLTNPNVAAAIHEALAERSQRTQITADRVLEEIAKLAFSNIGDYHRISSEGEPFVDLSNLSRDQMAALTELQVEDYTDGRGDNSRDVRRVKIKLADKKAALELLGRHLKLFTDKVDLTSDGKQLKSLTSERSRLEELTPEQLVALYHGKLDPDSV
jgi:phage terminase small subunit